jgi:GNAT superfamily N-acetyltransferase
VTGERLPLFCDVELAARIERAEAQLMARSSEAAARRGAKPPSFVIQIAGGVASFAEADSPFNKVAGMGFQGIPGETELEVIEHRFAAAGAPVQIELSQLADPALGMLLTRRGYRLVSFENVLGLQLRDRPAAVEPPGVEVRHSGDDELEAWLEVVIDGVANPDTQGLPDHEHFPRDVFARAELDFAAAGVTRYIARRDGVVAGGAGLRLADGIAQLTGAATAPAHRRRGVQTALLEARLMDAAQAGCEVAVVTTQPGSKSQENVQRRGFDLLYARAVLVRDRW